MPADPSRVVADLLELRDDLLHGAAAFDDLGRRLLAWSGARGAA